MSDGARRRGEGALARREKRLAYSLLLPTFALVLGVILLPLLANFWISFKPVTLADLRPPQLIVKEQLRGKLEVEGDKVRIEYRFRNSSIKYPLGDVSFTDSLPDGVRVTGLDEVCRIDEGAAKLTCELGDLEAKSRGRIRVEIEALTGTEGQRHDHLPTRHDPIQSRSHLLCRHASPFLVRRGPMENRLRVP